VYLLLCLVPVEERTEFIPEVKRVRDRKMSVEAMLRDQKELFIAIFQVSEMEPSSLFLMWCTEILCQH
jgi:hypothetical protein